MFFVIVLFLLIWPTFLLAQDTEKESIYIQAIQANPNDETAHYNLGVSYLKEQKFELAIPEFQKSIQLNSSDNSAKMLLEICEGIVEKSKENYSAAIEHFQNVLKIDPENVDAKRFLNICNVKVFVNEKNYPAAVTILNQIIETNPQDFWAFQTLGAIYFQLKDYKKVVEYLNQLKKLKEDPQVYKILGFSYYQLGDFTNAIDHYKKSIALESAKDPKDQDENSLEDTYYNLGVAYNDNALYDDAVVEFENAFKINPKDSNAVVAQGSAIDSAINAHMQQASNFLLNNQYSAAIVEWKKVLKYQSDNKQAQDFIADAQTKLDTEVEGYYVKGEHSYKTGNSVEALSEWNEGLKMDPDNEKILNAVKNIKVKNTERVKALLAEGDEFYEEKNYSDAYGSYSKASKIDSHSSKVKSRLTKLKKNQAKDTDAIFVKAMKYYSKNDLLDAKKYFLEAQELNPKDSRIGENLFKVQKDISNEVKDLDSEGVSLFEGGDKDNSKSKFMEALQFNPNDNTANDYVKRMTGEQAQAKVDAEKVKELYYDGVNLYINGKIHEAIAQWQECLKEDPNNVNAQSNINKAMVKLQSIEKLSQN
jgi:tetratricopeptide (TPR) repeat protein